MSFSGKVAIVTGGAQGIGKAYTIALLDIGMKVCIVDINEATAKEFIETLSEKHKCNVLFQKADVTSQKELKCAFDKTIEKFGRIDVVVNNAGICDEFSWEKSIDVNFKGVVNGIQLAYQYMGIENGGNGGVIVNTTSKAAFEPSPLCPVYTGTKFAVVGLTKSYGSDYHFKKSGIKICAIGPDVVDTEAFKGFGEKILAKDLFLEIKDTLIPIRPEELGKALVQILKDGKNGALMRVKLSGAYYV